MAYVVTAKWTANPGEEDRIARICDEMTEPSRAEPANRFYQAHRSPDDTRLFYLYEQYDDEAGYEAHMASEHFARPQRLRARRVGDHVRERVVHVGARVLAPQLAVDPHAHREVAGVQLVGGDEARAEHVRAVPVLRLARPHAHRQLAHLHVARRHVVPDRVAEDDGMGVLRGDVARLAADHRGELELVVEVLGPGRPRDLRLRPDHGVRHALVVGRRVVPLVGDGPAEAGERVLQMPLEREEVAQ